MANIKITELNAATSMIDNDVLPIVDVTNNETKKITKANLRGSLDIPEVKHEILWTNSSPSSSFTNQIINIDWEDYDIFEVWYRGGTYGGYVNVKKLTFYQSTELIDSYFGTNGDINYCSRMCSILYNGILFDSGKSYIDGTYTATDNSVVIPLYVIGYKTGLFSST